MSTATSIAQFMAILSGGSNPGLLKSNMVVPTQNGESKNAVAFEKLLNQSANGNVDVDAILATLENAGSASLGHVQQGIDKGDILRHITSLPRAQASDGEANASASIWQFIQQQANIDSGNQLVLNLSEKGIPDSVIQDLKAIFGENDLITIIRDPQLNAQFDNALKALRDNVAIVDGELVEIEVSNQTDAVLQTENLVAVVETILDQNQSSSINDLTFSVNDETTIDKVIENLVDNGVPENAAYSVEITEAQKPVKPVEFAIAQSQNGGDELPLQTANPVSNSVNPFTASAEKGNKSELKGLANAEARLTQNGGQGLDRVAALNAANTNQNAQSQSSNSETSMQSFADAMVSADGETLMVDGKFAVPFEAAFKTASKAANPILGQSNAAQNHPATHMAAMSLTKMAMRGADGEMNQRYRLQLDPPEMGRVDIEMDIIENTNKMKVVISAEKTESLGLLQRDMHTLIKAIQDAGFENVSSNDLSFNLSQRGEDMAGGHDNNGRGHPPSHHAGDVVEGDMDVIETQMSIIIDPVTGQQSVNMLV